MMIPITIAILFELGGFSSLTESPQQSLGERP